MTSDEIVRLSKKHTLFEWSPQGTFDPLPVARAKAKRRSSPRPKPRGDGGKRSTVPKVPLAKV